MNGSTVKLSTVDGQPFHAYLATPAAPNGAGVIVLQEIFGVNANIRSVADSFAEQGFNAIAPDLFWRQQPGVELDPADETAREQATVMMKGLDQQLAVADSLIAADHLRGLPGANGKVGAVGYCLGGKLAYLLAGEAGIDAAVSYYGVAIQGALDRIDQVQCKTLLHIAADDHLCPPEAQALIVDAASAASDKIEVVVHPGVGHAFARRHSVVFNAEAAERADTATLSLLRSALSA